MIHNFSSRAGLIDYSFTVFNRVLIFSSIKSLEADSTKTSPNFFQESSVVSNTLASCWVESRIRSWPTVKTTGLTFQIIVLTHGTLIARVYILASLIMIVSTDRARERLHWTCWTIVTLRAFISILSSFVLWERCCSSSCADITRCTRKAFSRSI